VYDFESTAVIVVAEAFADFVDLLEFVLVYSVEAELVLRKVFEVDSNYFDSDLIVGLPVVFAESNSEYEEFVLVRLSRSIFALGFDSDFEMLEHFCLMFQLVLVTKMVLWLLF
jgi:hypothetical protein